MCPGYFCTRDTCPPHLTPLWMRPFNSMVLLSSKVIPPPRPDHTGRGYYISTAAVFQGYWESCCNHSNYSGRNLIWVWLAGWILPSSTILIQNLVKYQETVRKLSIEGTYLYSSGELPHPICSFFFSYLHANSQIKTNSAFQLVPNHAKNHQWQHSKRNFTRSVELQSS